MIEILWHIIFALILAMVLFVVWITYEANKQGQLEEVKASYKVLGRALVKAAGSISLLILVLLFYPFRPLFRTNKKH